MKQQQPTRSQLFIMSTSRICISNTTMVLLWLLVVLLQLLETTHSFQQQVELEQQSTKCFGISPSDPSVCNGNGMCTSTNSCICSSGYSGNQCQTFSCFGISSISPWTCSRNGKCSKPNTCECNEGWLGIDCSLYNGTVSTKSQSRVSELNTKKIEIINKKATVHLPNNIVRHLENNGFSNNDSLIVVTSFQERQTNSQYVGGVLSFSLERLDGRKVSIIELETPIRLIFENVIIKESHKALNLSCAYFNEKTQGWAMDGLETEISSPTLENSSSMMNIHLTITCKTSHLTRFTVIDLNLNREIVKEGNSDTNHESPTYMTNVIVAAVVTSSVAICLVLSITIGILIFFAIIINQRRKRIIRPIVRP